MLYYMKKNNQAGPAEIKRAILWLFYYVFSLNQMPAIREVW